MLAPKGGISKFSKSFFAVFAMAFFSTEALGLTVKEFKQSGTWRAPRNVTTIFVEGVGGGGGGGGGGAGGGGGGASGTRSLVSIPVVSGQTYKVTVGRGGGGGAGGIGLESAGAAAGFQGE